MHLILVFMLWACASKLWLYLDQYNQFNKDYYYFCCQTDRSEWPFNILSSRALTTTYLPRMSPPLSSFAWIEFKIGQEETMRIVLWTKSIANKLLIVVLESGCFLKSTASFSFIFSLFQTMQIVFKKIVSSFQCWNSNSRPLQRESPPITAKQKYFV